MGTKLSSVFTLLLMTFVVGASGQWWDTSIDMRPSKYLPMHYSGPYTNSSGTFFYPGPDSEADYTGYFKNASEETAQEEEEETDRALFARIALQNRLHPPHIAGAKPSALLRKTTYNPKYHPEWELATRNYKRHDYNRIHLMRTMRDDSEEQDGLQLLPTPITATPTRPMSPGTTSPVVLTVAQHNYHPQQVFISDHTFQEQHSKSK